MTQAVGSKTTSPAPVVFFVDVDAPSLEAWHGPTVARAFLSAVLENDRDRTANFWTYSGKLVTHFTYRVINAASYPTSSGAPPGATTLPPHLAKHAVTLPPHLAKHLVSEAFIVDDYSSRYALLCTLCDSAAEGWTTLNQLEAPYILYSRAIHLIMASALSSELREKVDRSLRRFDWYLGAMEVDTGDPLQRRLFGQSLPLSWFYCAGKVGAEFEEDQYAPADLFEGLDVAGYGWSNREPLLAPPPEIQWTDVSEGGRRTAAVLERVTKRGHNEKLLAQVHGLYRELGAGRAVSLTVDLPEPDIDALKTKLYEYVLVPGKSKGKDEHFKKALDIEKEDWRFLAIQLVLGLRSATPRELRDRPYGEQHHLQYEVTVPVLGRNGKKKPVLAVWKIVDGKRPELVTAYLDSKKKTQAIEHESVFLVDLKPGTDTYYQKLYDTAKAVADRALNECVPTPMPVQRATGEILTIPGGMMGSAELNVPDARTGFARWLLKNDHATNGWPGAVIVAPTHSADRARAWVDAFAEVLRANSQTCKVSYAPD